jgi:hypothetical protein
VVGSAIAAVFSCASVVRGDDSAPRELPVVNDARPIELNAPLASDGANEPQPSVGSLRFSSPASAAGVQPSAGMVQSGTVLRWKGRQPEAAAATTGFTPRQSDGAWQDRTQKNWAAIVPAAHEDAPAPFQDPFGDKSPGSSTGIKLLPPGGVASGQQGLGMVEPASAEDYAPQPPAELLPSQSPVQKPSALRPGDKSRSSSKPYAAQKPSADLSFPPLPPTDSYVPDFPLPRPPAEQAPAKETPPSAEPLTPPRPSLGPPSSILENEARTGDVSCQRVYNDRNCCDEDRKCATARQALRDNSITKISLDITAPFKPDAATVGEEREAREGQLRQMPARDWKNRTGQVVASGRLQDVHNRKIQVAGADGQVAELRLGELSDDDLCFLAAWWGVPTECTLGDDQFVPRAWDQVTFTWKASALCHKPLYFEEVGLERYGHTMGPVLEPVHSGAHFFLNVAFLPYKMGINPPHECQYALGYYRPGNCAPWLLPPVPISLRGALFQGAAAVGLVYLFP